MCGVECKVQGMGCRVQNYEFGIKGLGLEFRFEGVWCRVYLWGWGIYV